MQGEGGERGEREIVLQERSDRIFMGIAKEKKEGEIIQTWLDLDNL